MVIIWLMMINNILVGGWAYPSEKWWSESQLGWWHSQLNGTIKVVFQTTGYDMNFNIPILYQILEEMDGNGHGDHSPYNVGPWQDIYRYTAMLWKQNLEISIHCQS